MSNRSNADLSNSIHSGSISSQELLALPALECSCGRSDRVIRPPSRMVSNTALEGQTKHEAKNTQGSNDLMVSGCPAVPHSNYEEYLSTSDGDLARDDTNSRKESSPAQQKYTSEYPSTTQVQRSQTKWDSSLESSECSLQTTRLANEPSPFILRCLRMSNSVRADSLDLIVQRNHFAVSVHQILIATITQVGMSLSYLLLDLEQPSWLLRDIAIIQRDFLGSWAAPSQLSLEILYFLSFMFSSTAFIVAQLFCYQNMSKHEMFPAGYSAFAVSGVIFWFALGATTLEVIIVFLPLTLNAGFWLVYTWQRVSTYCRCPESDGISEKTELLRGAGN